MVTLYILNSQSDPVKKSGKTDIVILRLQTIPQSYNNQNNMVLDENDMQLNGTELRAQN